MNTPNAKDRPPQVNTAECIDEHTSWAAPLTITRQSWATRDRLRLRQSKALFKNPGQVRGMLQSGPALELAEAVRSTP
jgi:hypothetical protein